MTNQLKNACKCINNSYKIIDLFAGPGGLGEGFSQFQNGNNRPFKIAVSIEKEKYAHATLKLRSFVRKFKVIPNEYYAYLSGVIPLSDLYELYPMEAALAFDEAWNVELGTQGEDFLDIVSRVKEQLGSNSDREHIIIGGPPCQAYSLVGRSKMSKNQDFASDPRHTLYVEYLRFIAEFKPAVFVMENVKGVRRQINWNT